MTALMTEVWQYTVMICGDSPVWGETVAAAEVAGGGSPSAGGPSPVHTAATISSRMSAQMESVCEGFLRLRRGSFRVAHDER